MSETKKHNPFRPNSPAPSNMFVGRIHELNRIDDALLKLREGNPSHIMIVGERGIGKSSLLLFANLLARGELSWLNNESFNYLTVQFSIDSNLRTLSLIKKVQSRIKRQLQKQETFNKLLSDSWSFLKKIEIASSRVHENALDEDELFDNFVYSLSDTCQSLAKENFLTEKGVKTKKEGIVFLIDEVDASSPELNLGSFLKNLAEALQVEGCNNVIFILSGLPRMRTVLRDSHPSSLRLFEELELHPLKNPDVKIIFERGLEHVNEKSTPQFSFSPQALEKMTSTSEGYPHFIQQIGFSTFETNSDSTISEKTANKAIFGKNGALDLIGDRYYRDMYFTNIKEDAYREILDLMADNLGNTTSRKALRDKFSKSDQILDNGIRTLKERNIILPVQGKRGQYKFQWIGFAVWIKFFTQKKQS